MTGPIVFLIFMLYLLCCYGIAFCIVIWVYTFEPKKVHEYESITNYRYDKCKHCGHIDSIYHTIDQRIMVLASPIILPIACIYYTGKFAIAQLTDIGPKKIAKYIRSNFLGLDQ